MGRPRTRNRGASLTGARLSLRDRIAADPELAECLRARARVLQTIRALFDADGFLEVTTPSLSPAADPALHLASFKTRLAGQPGGVDLYLPTSPEHHMKRMLAAGFGRIYQLGPCFRNAELGPLHNPEFCGLEWYQAGAGLDQTMERTERLVREVAAQVFGRLRFARVGVEVDLALPFERLPVARALRDLAGVRVPDDWNEGDLRAALAAAKITCAPDDRFDDLVNRALVGRVEPALLARGPVFLTDYPTPMAALARARPDNPCLAERFELFIAGLELCNGYGELTDPAEQRRRFEEQLAERARSGLEVPPLDEHLLQALSQGLPAAGGNALGVDRLLMLLCERERIEQVLAFPLALELDPEGRGATAGSP